MLKNFLKKCLIAKYLGVYRRTLQIRKLTVHCGLLKSRFFHLNAQHRLRYDSYSFERYSSKNLGPDHNVQLCQERIYHQTLHKRKEMNPEWLLLQQR